MYPCSLAAVVTAKITRQLVPHGLTGVLNIDMSSMVQI
jgi:hypothetical protein